MADDPLERFQDSVRTQDTHKRLKLAEDLKRELTSLHNYNGPSANYIIDGLVPWISSGNYKVSQYGLELVGALAYNMGPYFKSHISSVLPPVVDRLGDAKKIVRDQALEMLYIFMSPVSSPQHVFDILNQYFNHKNWRVREVLMVCLSESINRFTATSLQLSKITPHLVKLLADPTGQVRDTASTTMIEVYRHVGDRFRVDLSKRNIPEAKLNSLFAKFDQTQKSGNMIGRSEVDSGPTPERKKIVKSGNVRRSTSFSAGDKKKHHINVERNLGAGGSGAVDETDFMSLWEEVQDARVFTARDFGNEIDKLKAVLENSNNDWEKRVDALRELRSLVKISSMVDNFHKMAKELEESLRISVKDLRSTVVRDACVTLSYMSSVMGIRFDYLAENILSHLIILITNSAKVMSSSAHAAIRLIIKHTHSSRLIPIIISNLLTSKSKDIRRKCAEYLGLILEVWDTTVIKSHVPLIEEGLRKGISDADSEARAAVRRAFWHFSDHYKSKAENLMQTFDASKQKLLQSDRNLINAGVQRPTPTRSKSNLTKPSRSLSSNSTPNVASRKATRDVMGPPAVPSMQRSASQLEYKRPHNAPSMTPRQKSYDDLKRHQVRPGRSRVSQRSTISQPSSRTGSPKRMATMPTYSRERSEDFMKTVSPQKTRIPTPARSSSRTTSRSGSRHSSRDSSPTRPQVPGQNDPKSRTGQGITEAAIMSALRKGKKQRERNNSHGSTNGVGSDESDNSSISSRGESNNKRNVTMDYNEIINLLHHDSATQKRDGLLSMQALLQSIRHLSSDEAMRAKEIFNRYFAEPNAKLYSLFLDVLSEFVVQYKNDLKDWLFILLTRLLQRISTDILASAQKKIAQMLDIVRDTYPYDYQFQIITKYITDNTQTPTLKVKESLLQYTRGLIELMDASDFVNSAPIRLAVSRIVTWISEPKSADVRKEASAVILALFQLNSPEFSMMLYSLPSSIQEGATRVIQMGIKHQQPSTPQYSKSLNYTDRTTSYTAPAKSEHMERPLYRTASPAKMANKVTNVREDYNSPAAHNSVTRVPSSGRQDTYGEAAQQEPSNISARNKLSFTSPQYSTPPPFSTPSHDLVTPSANGDTPYSYATHYDAENSPMWLSSTTSYNPRQYEDSLIDTVPNMSLTSPVNRVADGAEQPDGSDDGMENSRNLLNEIGTVLSGSHNTNDSEDVKSALIELLKLTRSGNRDIVGQKLKQLIPSVLTLLKHKEATVRCLAARCLREICHSHPNSYRNNLHAFLLPLLQTESDSQKEVSKTAEECCALISQTLSPAEVLPVVAPLAGESPFPTNVSAIKMLNSVADNCDNRTMIQNIEAVVGNLLKAYDHQESMVRKAAVFCLVSVHNVAGADVVSPYFNELAGSKVKLLNLYIRRSQSSNV